MPLSKLDNFIRNIEGRILYVNSNDLNATDAITNDGTSLTTPFKTIQRALIESARFSYVNGENNDIVEKTTILLFPGEYIIDNRPGFAIYNNSNSAYAVPRSGGVGVLASSVLSLELNSNFDLTQEDNILYKFNSYYGGVVVPRGTSIIGLDLRKTKIRPKYVPNPTDSNIQKSAIFRLTGASYFWQISIFDGDPSGLVYTDPDNFTTVNQSTPNFSHHKLTCFEYCDGVNKIGSYGITDLDMYYAKLSNAFNNQNYRFIDQKYPQSTGGFAKRNPEWEIVGTLVSDPISISSIISGNGSTATSIITVTTSTPHKLDRGTPIKISGVSGSGVTAPYNISTVVQNILSPTSFTYLLPAISAYPSINPSPSSSSAKVIVETDTVSGASPYISNCSLRSVWGMNGLHADGSKSSGFRSIVVAQFTAISLQKDDRAFAKYDKLSRTYQSVTPILPVSGSSLPDGASQTDSTKIYHLDPDAVYRSGWESSHVKITNDAFIQIVSIFAIGFSKHFDAESGGDASITNSNSNFGQISLNSSGFKRESFDKDNNVFITSIVPPREIENSEETIEWLSLNVGLTTTVGISSHLYLYGFTSQDDPPSILIQGYRVGARENDKLCFVGSGSTYSAFVCMCDNEISKSAFTVALGSTVSVKSYNASIPTSGLTTVFTIGTNALLTGEKVKILSDDGNLPENITEHETYYSINNGDNNTIKLAASYTDALQNQPITVSGGTNLKILSRVSDKSSGDLGSPIQYDALNKNWFIHVNRNNEIYNALLSGGTSVYGDTTDLTFIKRISDERSLNEKLYKFRAVIPKELQNARDPQVGFVIQESKTTGLRSSLDFTRTSIDGKDYEYRKNLRLIANCSVVANTVGSVTTYTTTILSELPHNLQIGDLINIKNVKSSTNASGEDGLGYNGRFKVTNILNSHSFEYITSYDPGIFTQNSINTRDENLPRFERNDLQSNLYIYRTEVISPYIYNQQDGVYHLYVLNANNSISDEFTDLKYSQIPVDLYPQLDRDNVESNPKAAKTYAKSSPLGAIVTNDLKKSITRETADLTLKTLGIGLTISSVASSSGISTISFSRFHGLAGIITGSVVAGSGYTSGTYYNVKLLNNSQSGTWNGATANVVVSGGSVSSASIVSPGSGYASGSLYFDASKIGAGTNALFNVSSTGIKNNVGNVIQFTGDGRVSDSYYRITSILSSTQIAIAKTSGDPSIHSTQYAFVVGPSVQIQSTSFNSSTSVTTFVTTTSHGLIVGNKFRVNDSSNNNLGDYIVKDRLSVTSFTAVTNSSISATNGYILRHGISSNIGISDEREENFGVRHVSFYDDSFILSSSVTTGTTLSITNASRLILGSYIQIDSEIMRVISGNNVTTVTVLRGALGTNQENHDANSVVRKINPIAVEFRRPSILRASGHTFEYLGYGPGNYSTGLPQVQVKTLNDQENFLAQSQERSCGVVVYSAMNSDGDVFNGNTKTSASSGEITSFDIPKPTVTGEDPNKLSVAFDEVTIKERLLVEGGNSGSVLSQFNGPVTFNKDINVKSPATFSKTVRIIQGNQSTSTTTGDLIVSGGVGIGGSLYGTNAAFNKVRTATLGFSTSDVVSFDARIGSSLIPSSTTGSSDLGSPTNKWGTLYVNAISGNLSGAASSISIVSDTSSSPRFLILSSTSTNGVSSALVNSGISYVPSTGTLSLQNLNTTGNIVLGNSTGTAVTFTSRIGSGLTPTGTFDLGSSTNRWGTLYANTLFGNLTGSSSSITAVSDNNTNANRPVVLSSTTSGITSALTDAEFTYNPSSNTLNASNLNTSNIGGNITFTGSTVTFNSQVGSGLTPSTTNTHDLGGTSNRWRNLYANTLFGNVTGSSSSITAVSDNNTNANRPVVLSSTTSGITSALTDAEFTYNPSNNTLDLVNLNATGSATLGNDVGTDTVTFNSRINSDFRPTGNGARNLGAVGESWGTLYVNNIVGASVAASSSITVSSDSSATPRFLILSNVGTTGIANPLVGSALTYVTSTDTLTLGNLNVKNNITLGDATSDIVTFVSRVNSGIVPFVSNTYDLGSSANRWRDVYGNLVGAASSITAISDSSSTPRFLVLSSATSGITSALVGSGISFIPATNTLTLQNLNANSNVVLGATSANSVTFNSRVGSGITPSVDNAYDLGSPSNRWKSLYVGTIFGSVSGAAGTITITNDTENANRFLVLSSVNTGISSALVDSDITYNPGRNLLTLQNLNTTGGVVLGNSTGTAVTFTSRIGSGLTPSTSGTFDLGSSTNRWNDIYGNLIGSATSITVTSSSAGTDRPLVFSSGTSGAVNPFINTNLTYSPSTNILNVPILNVTGNAILGATSANSVTFNSRVGSGLTPSGDRIHDLGSPSNRWKNIYVETIIGTISGAAGTITVTNDTADANRFLVLSSQSAGITTVLADNDITYNPGRNLLTLQNLNTTGGVVLGNSTGTAVTFTSRIGSGLTPSTSGTFDLGSSTNRWKDIYGNLIGTASTATTITVGSDSTDTNRNIIFSSGTSGAVNSFIDTDLTYNPSTNTLNVVNLNTTGNTTLGNNSSQLNPDLTSFNSRINSDFIPSSNGTRNLGEFGASWNNLYVNNIVSTGITATSIRVTAVDDTTLRYFVLSSSSQTGNISPSVNSFLQYRPSDGLLAPARLSVYEDTYLGGDSTNIVRFNANIDSNLIPTTFAYNIGSPSNRWNNIYGNLVGAASSITAVSDNNTNATRRVVLSSTTSGITSALTDAEFTYNPSSNTLSVPNINATAGTGVIPIGAIIMWAGRTTEIPTGWALCNGGTVNGFQTPDLRSRFVIGWNATADNYPRSTLEDGVTVRATGGTKDAVIVNHVHNIQLGGSHNHTASVTYRQNGWTGTGPTQASDLNGTGSTETVTTSTAVNHDHGMDNPTGGEPGAGKNLPPYYALFFIVRVS